MEGRFAPGEQLKRDHPPDSLRYIVQLSFQSLPGVTTMVPR